MAERSALVIGGGISGLTSGYNLAKLGYRVTLLERREVLGGLARSRLVGGKPLEVYYHFICGGDRCLLQLIEELGLSHLLRWAPARTAYFVDGHLYPLTSPFDLLKFTPLSLAERLRFGRLMLYCRRSESWQHLEELSAVEWLRQRLGYHAYDVVWRSLLDLKFGEYASQISAPWVWHRLHRVTESRANVFRPEQMGYLAGGTEVLLEALRREIEQRGGQIRLGVEATELCVSGGAVIGARSEEEEFNADLVVAATQIPDLRRLLPASAASYRAELAKITFIGITCVMLQMEHNLTDFFWVNSNDARVPCNGFIEYTNLNPLEDRGGTAVTYFPYYSATEAPPFRASDEQVTGPLIASLGVLRPDLPLSHLRELVVNRDAYAQAICPAGFSRRVPAIATPLPNLYLLDSTQLYPSDRCLSGMIGLSNRMTQMALQAK